MGGFDAARRQVAHDAVGDLEDARQLVERLRLGVELEQVVDAVGLLVDLVGELAPAPGIVADPGAAALLHQLAGAADDLVVPLLGEVGVEHEQNLVVVHVPECLLRSGRPYRLHSPLGKTAGW